MDQTTYDASAPRRKRRRALIAILLSASLATLSTGAMTMALFTDTETGSGSWSTGTIDLGLGETVTFSAADILPGDTGTHELTVSNAGTGQFRYSLEASVGSGSTALADQLDLAVELGSCGGTELYSGPLSGVAGKLFGDSAQGPDAGDRELDPGNTEVLCLSWGFPLDSDNSFKLLSTSVTFTFDAEQTAHNP